MDLHDNCNFNTFVLQISIVKQWHTYEGHLINKFNLQSGAISLTLKKIKIGKILNIHYIGNYVPNVCGNSFDDDVIIVMCIC